MNPKHKTQFRLLTDGRVMIFIPAGNLLNTTHNNTDQTKIFWARRSPGNVRFDNGFGNYVCEGLRGVGNTIEASAGEDLLETIRHHYKKYRRVFLRDELGIF